jgi:large subunit ribosomal protein L18e
MKSKTLISKQAERKGNPDIVETIRQAKKNEKWIRVASIVAYPRRKRIELNLDIIDKESKEGDIVVVPGKVLGKGEINKKIVIAALGFSEEARNKLKEKKCEIKSILEEINKNPKAQGIKALV